jgi:hypothetical protein
MKSLLGDGCKYVFLIEDDIIVKDSGVFLAYIEASIQGRLEHMNFAHHGPANASGRIEAYNDKVDLYPHVVGAFSFYTANCLNKVGLMDEGFKNCWEHVEHTARIAEAGLTTPFWKFADIASSRNFLEEIEGSISNSSIRDSASWSDNIRDGLDYWKTQLDTPCPL